MLEISADCRSEIEMSQKELKIAYLAPEIPALSATFVYNEILALIKQGISVVAVSVHKPGAAAEGTDISWLVHKTCYLYQQGFWKFAAAHIYQLITSPLRYVRTVLMVLSDILKSGVVTQLGLGLSYRFWVSAYLAFFLKRNQCTHLHVHFAHIPTDLAMYAARLSGIPFSFTAHANDLFERGWLLKEKVERARFAVTISAFNHRFLQQRGAPGEKIHVVHCGVPSAQFTTRPPRKMGNPVCIGALGRMVEKKGFDDLISACRILMSDGFSFHLDLVGDGPLQGCLQEKVRQLCLEEQVYFRGALPHEAVPAWMRKLDLFVLPCKADANGDMDGIPVVLMEAMLSGVPVVSTNISGIPELVENEETGGLAEANNPEDLAGVIRRICNDTNLQAYVCSQAADRVRSQFDLIKNANRLLSLFKENCHDESR